LVNLFLIYQVYSGERAYFIFTKIKKTYLCSEWKRPRRLLDIAAAENTVTTYSGEKTYELSNHLGNVLAVVSDALIDDAPSVVSATDYYAFGQEMPGRIFNDKDYRYGYQGQEQEDDIWESGVAYKYRISDSRLGRFFSVDPLTAKYPFYSTYAFSGNRVMDMVELEGAEPVSSEDKHKINKKYGYQYGNGEVRDISDPYKNDAQMSIFQPSNSNDRYVWKDWNGNDAVFSEATFDENAKGEKWSGHWVGYKTIEQQSQQAKSDFCDAANNTPIALAAAAYTLPMVYAEGVIIAEAYANGGGMIASAKIILGASLSSRLASGGYDFLKQTISNKGDWSKYAPENTGIAMTIGLPVSGAIVTELKDAAVTIGNGEMPSLNSMSTNIFFGSLGGKTSGAIGDKLYMFKHREGTVTFYSNLTSDMLLYLPQTATQNITQPKKEEDGKK
jgi:RHS repeat-associated protein